MSVLTPAPDPFKVYKYGDPEILSLTTHAPFRTGQIQDYEQLLSQYSGSNGWVDPEFPHIDASVGSLEDALDTANVDVQANASAIKWLRIKDYAAGRGQSNYTFDAARTKWSGDETPVFSIGGLSNGVGRMDVKQGTIGNCWFVAAVSALAEDAEDIRLVVPADNEYNDAGVYHFRFWLQGIWIDVPVDDYIPCKFNMDTYLEVGAKLNKVGDQVEFWVALLEKAYAKLMGTYAITVGNFPMYALENMTGGFGEARRIAEGVEPELYDTIKGLLDKKGGVAQRSIVCLTLSPSGNVCGLPGQHAYSVTATATVYENNGGSVNLLRIRNPHGTHEWKGDWSDPPAGDYYSNSGSRWDNVSEDQKRALGVECKDEGEFYMAWTDVISVFTQIDVCNIVRETDLRQADWNVYHGEWSNAEDTAGGSLNASGTAKNPQVATTVSTASGKGVLFATMLLKLGLEENIPDGWGFNVYRVEDESQDPPLDASFFQQTQELEPIKESEVMPGMRNMELAYKTTARAYIVPNGKYVVVPFLQSPKKEGRFCLRILNQCR